MFSCLGENAKEKMFSLAMLTGMAETFDWSITQKQMIPK